MNDTPQDFWNQRYQAEGFLFGREPNAFVKSQAHLFKPGQNVLSIADGEGRNGVFVACQGARVTSVDFSAPALEKARRLAEEFSVEITIEQQDIYEWHGTDGAYDIVLAIFIQFAPPEKRTLLFDNIKRLVKPGGLVVMQGYRPEQVAYKTGGPPEAENMYTSDLLRTAFADFDIQHLEGHDSIVDEGSGHSGLSALIDMIAQRPH
ncbi:MAG: class I SAM-dependent methyltransferase [Rhodospirillales bacterium]|nr:class I SAM-dependent methyltransferase [Rhodospirillales bacterium]